MISGLLDFLPTATDWVTAGFGLAGVIVGGLITTGTTMWVQQRADDRARQAEERELTATCSLLHSNLREVKSSLKAIERDQAWSAPIGDQWLSAWQDRAPALASGRSREEFEAVAEGFLIARLLIWQTSEEERDFTTADRDLVARWHNVVSKALSILE
ncbi:MAG: hypothetical protein ACTHKT_05060 [Solirubrobacterales bacterium]